MHYLTKKKRRSEFLVRETYINQEQEKIRLAGKKGGRKVVAAVPKSVQIKSTCPKAPETHGGEREKKSSSSLKRRWVTRFQKDKCLLSEEEKE